MNPYNKTLKVLEDFRSNPGPKKSETPKTLQTLKNSFKLMSSGGVTKLTREKNLNLTDIFIDGFDQEQIWQQIELKNRYLSSYVPVITKFLFNSKNVHFPLFMKDNLQNNEDNKNDKDVSSDEIEKSGDKINSSGESSDDNAEHVDSSSEGSDFEEELDKSKFVKGKNESGVEDGFFNLNEMEKFLDDAEKDTFSQNDDIDLFEDIPSDSENVDKNAKYNDFFKNPGEENKMQDNEENNSDEMSEDSQYEGKSSKKKVRFSVNDDSEVEDSKLNKSGVKFSLNENDDSDSESDEDKTAFKGRELKLREKIKKLEEANLSEKPWKYKGEVNINERPINSLLEEVLDVDLSLRPPPVITENVTNTLEQIIYRRIKDSAYDDVERKIKPIRVPHELRKELVLNQEKSKYSLAEVYEQEYLKRKPTENTSEESNKPDIEKEKIKKAMKSVFHKLDILSNFHYTPKPASADITVVSNMPAITMEEVTPVAMSDANLLAPQEVTNISKKKLMSKDERTKTDKLRERRKKKKFLAQKFKRSQNSEKTKLSKVLKAKNVHLLKTTGDTSLKSSTSFFKKLQEDSEVGKVRAKKKGTTKS